MNLLKYLLILNGMTANQDVSQTWFLILGVEIFGTCIGSLLLYRELLQKKAEADLKQIEFKISYWDCFKFMAFAMAFSFLAGLILTIPMGAMNW